MHSRLADIGPQCEGAPAIVVADLSRPDLYPESDKDGKVSMLLNGALLAAQQGNSVFRCAMDRVYGHIERRVMDLNPLGVSGPRVLGDCVRQTLGQHSLSFSDEAPTRVTPAAGGDSSAGAFLHKLIHGRRRLQWGLPHPETELGGENRKGRTTVVHRSATKERVCVLRSHIAVKKTSTMPSRRRLIATVSTTQATVVTQTAAAAQATRRTARRSEEQHVVTSMANYNSASHDEYSVSDEESTDTNVHAAKERFWTKWVKQWSAQHKREFFVNPETKETAWRMPEGGVEVLDPKCVAAAVSCSATPSVPWRQLRHLLRVSPLLPLFFQRPAPPMHCSST